MTQQQNHLIVNNMKTGIIFESEMDIDDLFDIFHYDYECCGGKQNKYPLSETFEHWMMDAFRSLFNEICTTLLMTCRNMTSIRTNEVLNITVRDISFVCVFKDSYMNTDYNQNIQQFNFDISIDRENAEHFYDLLRATCNNKKFKPMMTHYHTYKCVLSGNFVYGGFYMTNNT